MKHVFHPLLLIFVCIAISSSAQDSLQNPDFESPPAAINVTSQVFLLTKANSIPGWSFNGTVWYLTASANSSFKARQGHAVQLGENGRINQTLRGTADGYWDHILSFNLAALNEGCAADSHAAVNVSVLETWKVFFLGRNLSRDMWERYAFYMGGWGRGDSVNLEIASVASNSGRDGSSCWPVVDAFTVKRNGMPRWYEGNMLANGDFEVGPAFLSNSSEGILLNDEPDRLISPLQQWSVLGTIRYIDSKHYKVPQGKAAVELLSGAPSGIQVDLKLPTTLTSYMLNFTMGDANDSCVGDFILYVQTGVDVHNFTMRSNGTGSASRHSVRFKADPSRETSIRFYSFNETKASDGVLCGPVLDNVVLVGSHGDRIELCNGVLVLSLFIALVIVIV
ncbi:UNVERIFIED_CONTAM: hypothetical protein Sangu_0529700 [Sesamum angustifolium]|uniref:DUF642 domain-containing protein n=1 Tax=Sesamum angustifolium TaxID=2727405 RepID=A0AAW2Q9P2_9LAMI